MKIWLQVYLLAGRIWRDRGNRGVCTVLMDLQISMSEMGGAPSFISYDAHMLEAWLLYCCLVNPTYKLRPNIEVGQAKYVYRNCAS